MMGFIALERCWNGHEIDGLREEDFWISFWFAPARSSVFAKREVDLDVRSRAIFLLFLKGGKAVQMILSAVLLNIWAKPHDKRSSEDRNECADDDQLFRHDYHTAFVRFVCLYSSFLMG